jgi:hypothetical protein
VSEIFGSRASLIANPDLFQDRLKAAARVHNRIPYLNLAMIFHYFGNCRAPSKKNGYPSIPVTKIIID